jgi:hypothetical protein
VRVTSLVMRPADAPAPAGANAAFATEDEAIAEASKHDGVLRFNPGKLERALLRDDLQTSATEADLLEGAKKFIEDSAGATKELAGQQTNATSGKAIQARQRQGENATYHFIDNLAQGQRRVGVPASFLVFDLAAHCLAPGGQLVFNIFVARDGYTPDDAARELGQQCYTSIFTSAELAGAASLHPLHLIADDSVHDYEKDHLPADKWPPTSWYAHWVSGLDVFDVAREECPIELRWLVYRKVGKTK